MAKDEEPYEGYQPPAPSERLVDRVWFAFHNLNTSLAEGLQHVMEESGVPAHAMRAVDAYMEGVNRMMAALETNVVELARRVTELSGPAADDQGRHAFDELFAPVASPPQRQMDALFAEWRADERAAVARDTRAALEAVLSAPPGMGPAANDNQKTRDGGGRER